VDNNWSTPGNWSPAGPPAPDADVVINVNGARVQYDLPTGTTAANNITIGGTATLALPGVDFLIGGALTILPSAVLETDGTAVVAQLDNQGTWNVFHNTAAIAGHGIGAATAHTNSGTIQMNVPLWIDLEEATFTNTGVMIVNDILTLNIWGGQDNPTFTNSGTGQILVGVELIVQGGGTFNFEAGTLGWHPSNFAPPTFTLDGTTANFTPAFSTNDMVMNLMNGAVLNGPGTLTNEYSEAPLVLNSSAIGAPLVNDDSLEVLGSSAVFGTSTANNGVLFGTGTLDVSGTTFTNPGVLSPAGLAIGQLSLDGNLTQTGTSEIDIQLGGTTAAPNFDRLAIFGNANFTGTTLNGFRWDSYVPANDAVLTIINCGGVCSGTFDNTTINIGGVALTITVNSDNVQLKGPSAP